MEEQSEKGIFQIILEYLRELKNLQHAVGWALIIFGMLIWLHPRHGLHEASIFLPGLLLVICQIVKQINWKSLTAIGTVGTVILALWHQDIGFYFLGPKLDLQYFEPFSCPNPDVEARLIKNAFEVNNKKYEGMFVYLNLLNSGKSTANDVEIRLTQVWTRKGNSWVPYQNKKWIPIPVFAGKSQPLKAIPNCPILISIGNFSLQPGYLNNLKIDASRYEYGQIDRLAGQNDLKPPYEFCLEITIYCQELDPVQRGLYISFLHFPKVSDGEIEKLSECVTKFRLAPKSEEYPKGLILRMTRKTLSRFLSSELFAAFETRG